MKLTDHIYLIGSGAVGISNPGDCNVYAIESDGETALIDCGLAPDPEKLFENLERDGVSRDSIRYLFLTHAHTDHVAAMPAIQAMGVRVCASPVTAQIMEEGFREFFHLETVEPGSFEAYLCSMARRPIDWELADGETVQIGMLTLRTIATPGHTPDSLCYLLEDGEKRYLFSGDTLFYRGRVNYFQGELSRPGAYPETIRRLAALRPDGLLPGHILFTLSGARAHIAEALAAVEQGRLPEKKPYS